MMNQSGALVAAALDHAALEAALREKEERLLNAASHDHLTGLPDRMLLADRPRWPALHGRATEGPGQPTPFFALARTWMPAPKSVMSALVQPLASQIWTCSQSPFFCCTQRFLLWLSS